MQRCPDCDAVVDAESINITEGVALCAQCGKLARLSELNFSERSVEEVLSKPPAGCAAESFGLGVVLTASLRSVGGFIITAAFALFWNGIVSLFVLLAIAGLYTNLVGPLPDWFPAPGLNEGQPEMNGGPMTLGMTLFLCIFLTPFVVIGICMTIAALLNLLGKVEVVVDEYDSYVATGVSFIQWKRRFNAREVRAVNFGKTKWQSGDEGKHQRTIELVADRTINFGSMLTSERMEWLRVILKDLLLSSERNNRTRKTTTLPRLDWISRRY